MDERALEGFLRLCEEEVYSGGPDPQYKLMEHLFLTAPMEDRLWLCCLYVVFYDLTSAEYVWHHLSPRAGDEELREFIYAEWRKLTVKTERMGHRTMEETYKSLRAVRDWLLTRPWERYYGVDAVEAYQSLYQELVQGVYSIGRYFAIKLLEGARRAGMDLCMDRLIARDGESPRRALKLIFTEELAHHNPKDNSPAACEEAERFASLLKDKYVPHLDWFSFQTLLCQFKAAAAGVHYPGISLDEILEYWANKAPLRQSPSLVMELRPKLFPREFLGELNGWNRIRLELRKLYRDRGIMWSDRLYDYRTFSRTGRIVCV